MILGAATNFLGAAGQLVTPMIPGYDSQKLKTIPGITSEERIQELIEAEKLLKESTLREESGRS